MSVQGRTLGSEVQQFGAKHMNTVAVLTGDLNLQTIRRDDRTYRGIRKGGPAIGFEESIQVVEDVSKEFGPFDGILGFSQGGCFVGLLCDLQQRNLLRFKFDFAVLISAFKSNSLPHLKYYSDRITLPSLHIFGENDDIIPTEMSEALRDAFDDAITVTHPGGHYLPATVQQKHEYQRFFRHLYMKKYVDEPETDL